MGKFDKSEQWLCPPTLNPRRLAHSGMSESIHSQGTEVTERLSNSLSQERLHHPISPGYPAIAPLLPPLSRQSSRNILPSRHHHFLSSQHTPSSPHRHFLLVIQSHRDIVPSSHLHFLSMVQQHTPTCLHHHIISIIQSPQNIVLSPHHHLLSIIQSRQHTLSSPRHQFLASLGH